VHLAIHFVRKTRTADFCHAVEQLLLMLLFTATTLKVQIIAER